MTEKDDITQSQIKVDDSSVYGIKSQIILFLQKDFYLDHH